MPQKPTKSPLHPKRKHKNSYSSIIHLTDDSTHSPNEMSTMKSFQIEPNSLSHQQVTQMIDRWGAFQKIQQKFFAWEFSFQYQKILNIVPENFYTTAIHYVFMKKLSLLIKDFDQNQVLKKSLQLKEIYKIQSLSGKLKGKRFDYLLLVTVKLISFFLGMPTHEIIINNKLEAEIYAILVFVLLGTQVGQKAYSAIKERYRQKPIIKFNGRSEVYKDSIILPNMSKHSSQHQQTLKQPIRSKKRIGKTECRMGTGLFHQLSQEQEQDQITEIRQLVKAHLAVKEFVPKPKPKQTLDQVLAKVKDIVTQNEELKQVKAIEKKQMKHRVINYTQMSCSLDLNRSNQSLNTIHNYSLKIKPQKRSKYYQMLKKQDLKPTFPHEQNPLKLPKIQKPKQQVYSYQAMIHKKMSGHYWNNIIGQMKENKFENIEQFRPIGAKMYFQQDEQQEDRKVNRVSETVDVMQSEASKDNSQSGNAQFLTQRIVQTSHNLRQTCHQLPTFTKLPPTKKPAHQSKLKQTISILPILSQIQNQINILQYSSSTNIKQIYKNQKASMNVYSSQPLDNLNHKMKKKSLAQLKKFEKRFSDQCEIRRQRIEVTYFR